MTTRTRSRLVAAILVLAVGGLVTTTLVVRVPSERFDVATRSVGGAAADRVDAPPQVAVDEVRLELLRPAAGSSPEVGRNPFRFEARAEPAREAAPVPGPVVEPVPSGPPPVPPIALRFIGILEGPMPTGRVAILTDGRGNVFNGKAGDVIEGRYRVVSVGLDAAELSYLDGRGRQILRLSGQ